VPKAGAGCPPPNVEAAPKAPEAPDVCAPPKPPPTVAPAPKELPEAGAAVDPNPVEACEGLPNPAPPGEAALAAPPKPPLGEPLEKAAKPLPPELPKAGALVGTAGVEENKVEPAPALADCPKPVAIAGWPKPGDPVAACAPTRALLPKAPKAFGLLL